MKRPETTGLKNTGPTGLETPSLEMAVFETAVEDWVVAERSGRDTEAEQALAAVFGALPSPRPSASFADRVLVGVGLRPVPVIYPWWGRMVIAASLMIVGLALAYTLPLTFGLSRLVAPNEIAGLLVQSFIAVLSRIDEVLAIGSFCASLLRTLMLVVASPPVVMALLVLTSLSVLTFRGLSDLVASNRNSPYVQAL